MTSLPRLLFYCQHSLGMGHLMRSLALVRALSHHFEVTLVSGGAWPVDVPMPAGVHTISLPPVGMDEAGTLVSRDLACSLEDALSRRCDMLTRTWAAADPHVILVELFPFGRRKFAAELRPMLDGARARRGGGRPRVFCSLRDLLVGRQARQRQHDEWALAALARHFDGVFVHSDPAFSRIEESLTPGLAVPVPVTYTGFVHDGEARSGAPPQSIAGSIVVSAGGGIVGGPLLSTTLLAHANLPRGSRRPLTVVAGPFLPVADWEVLERLARPHDDVRLLRSVPDLALELRQAAGAVSQCGYNTAMDLVATGVPALVVPYAEHGEDEQSNRARRLAARGLLQVLSADALTPDRMSACLESLPSFRPSPSGLDLDGAACTARLLAIGSASVARAEVAS